MRLTVHVVALERKQALLQVVLLLVGFLKFNFQLLYLLLQPNDLLLCLLFLQLGLLAIFFHRFVLVHLLQVDGKLLGAHFKLHAQLHDQFLLFDDLLLCLLQLLVSVAYLQLNVRVSHFQLVVDSLHFIDLNGVLGIELVHVLLELIDQLLLVTQLLFEHL